jgi:hypothetical protein
MNRKFWPWEQDDGRVLREDQGIVGGRLTLNSDCRLSKELWDLNGSSQEVRALERLFNCFEM